MTGTMTDSTIKEKVKKLLQDDEREIQELKDSIWSMLELSICNPNCENQNIKSKLFDSSKAIISILDILEK